MASLGRAALRKREEIKAKRAEQGAKMMAEQAAHMESAMDTFQKGLMEFATKHSDDIAKDPVFRREFASMCAAIGVDPLQSSRGFWAKTLGVG